MPVTHAFSSAKSDGADATLVRASNWNADHVVADALSSVSGDHGIADGEELTLATGGSGSNITLTLPTAVGRNGKVFKIKRVDSGTAKVIIATTSSQTIDGATTYDMPYQWQYVEVESDGSNWVIVNERLPRATVTYKTGSGGGNYTRTSNTFADVDGTNLVHTVVVPIGWKLIVQCKFRGNSSDTSANLSARFLDSAGDINDDVTLSTSLTGLPALEYVLLGVVTGDGDSHTISLQFASSVDTHQVNIANSAVSNSPKMVFMLIPAA